MPPKLNCESPAGELEALWLPEESASGSSSKGNLGNFDTSGWIDRSFMGRTNDFDFIFQHKRRWVVYGLLLVSGLFVAWYFSTGLFATYNHAVNDQLLQVSEQLYQLSQNVESLRQDIATVSKEVASLHQRDSEYRNSVMDTFTKLEAEMEYTHHRLVRGVRLSTDQLNHTMTEVSNGLDQKASATLQRLDT
jgi:regulator of replication initiation timing